MHLLAPGRLRRPGALAFDRQFVTFARLAPINGNETVAVVFDPEARSYAAMARCAWLGGRTDLRGRTAHILYGSPGKKGYYLMIDMATGTSVYERMLVRDFSKAKLQRERDGRVILVQEE